MTLARLREALAYMFLPLDEKLKLAKAATGSKKPPAFLDDDVWLYAKSLGYTKELHEPTQPGDIVGTDGLGTIVRVVLTDAGRAFLAQSEN